MNKLTSSAQRLVDHLVENDYCIGDYLPASRLNYLFDQEQEKAHAVRQLTKFGLVEVAANGALGILRLPNSSSFPSE